MTIRSLFIASACGLLLPLPSSGMDGAVGNESYRTIPASGAETRVGLLQATQGLDKLRAERYSEASGFFNAALKFEPDNAHLHFLNGLSYHLLYTQGYQANRDLAETAYNMSLRLAPDHTLSAYYLGMLHLDARQYVKAQAAFAHALLLERDDPAALRALAMASYYAHDLSVALWAIGRIEQTQEATADTLRAAAIIHAAAGRSEEARKRTEQLRNVAATDSAEQVGKRVQHWQRFHQNNQGKLIRTGSQTVPLTPEALSDTNAPIPPPPASPAASGNIKPDAASGEILRNWSDCPQGAMPQNMSSAYSYGSSSFKDETIALPPLPAPCDRKALPRMALLDTAIISTFDYSTSSKGINLLDGLRLFMNLSFSDSNEPGGSPRVKAYKRTASFENVASAGASGALAYSLNIANAGNDWNQVLARPTLIALDRQPSTFFSGTSMSVVVTSNFSSGSLVDRPAGISLSVTPTFIDDENLLLSVRVSRSYFVDDLDGEKNTVTTSRNAVSTNVMMKMGETLILSGLTERQSNETKAGVPLLQDLPVLQYLFSKESKNDYTQSVLVMITPRPPVTGVNAPLANTDTIIDPRQKSSLDELKQQASQTLQPIPNLSTVFSSMENNPLFREFRSGDLRAENWRRPALIERTLRQIADFMYY